MLLSKDELLKKAEHYSELSAKASRNYQMTGLSRYGRDRDNYEDLADIYRVAASSSDDHCALGYARAEIIGYASLFENAIRNNDVDALRNKAESFISFAVMFCSFKRAERPCDAPTATAGLQCNNE